MASDSHRSITLTRLDTGVYRATNPTGASIEFGSLMEDGLSPVELLLAAIAGCSAVDVDVVTSRRTEPEDFTVRIGAEYVRDDSGNILTDIRMTFDLTFPEGEDGDKARRVIPGAVKTSHDRTCTVSRTVEAATPVVVDIL
ncbi:OsmC family protein [Euzebya tangerina]|uniref:OsmC family protein n=1 Tax=Euzebya tangerina TaxID=591198 RepID=UPI000E31E354|nr:OsmC family protein [Euzebya tangerina]